MEQVDCGWQSLPRVDENVRFPKVPLSHATPNRSKFTRKYLVYGLGVFVTIAAVWLAATDGGGGGDDGYLWGVPDVDAHDFI